MQHISSWYKADGMWTERELEDHLVNSFIKCAIYNPELKEKRENGSEFYNDLDPEEKYCWESLMTGWLLAKKCPIEDLDHWVNVLDGYL